MIGTFVGVCGVFYGAGGCWSAGRRACGLKHDVLTLKLCIFSHTPTPCLHQPVATHLESAVSGSCAKGDNDDKKIELMVLISTSHVAPHISGYISTISLFLNQYLFRWC